MLLDLSWSIQPKSVAGLAHDTLVDKVGRLQRPALRQLIALDAHLFGKDHVSDLLPRPANVRSFAHHELVEHDAEGEIINGKSVILPTHYFWRHVARRPRSILAVLFPLNLCNAHICDPNVTSLFHDDVLRFDISMDDALSVHILKSLHHARDDKFCFIL
jgi:hypothetical protein